MTKAQTTRAAQIDYDEKAQAYYAMMRGYEHNGHDPMDYDLSDGELQYLRQETLDQLTDAWRAGHDPDDALEAAADHAALDADELKPMLQELVDSIDGMTTHKEAAEAMIEYIDEQLQPA